MRLFFDLKKKTQKENTQEETYFLRNGLISENSPEIIDAIPVAQFLKTLSFAVMAQHENLAFLPLQPSAEI